MSYENIFSADGACILKNTGAGGSMPKIIIAREMAGVSQAPPSAL
jgi:hypothetical protein